MTIEPVAKLGVTPKKRERERERKTTKCHSIHISRAWNDYDWRALWKWGSVTAPRCTQNQNQKKTKEKRLKSFHGACEPSGNRRRPHTAATKWYTIRNDGIKGVTQPFHSTKKKNHWTSLKKKPVQPMTTKQNLMKPRKTMKKNMVTV